MQSTGKMPAYKPERLHISRPLIPDVSHGLYVSFYFLLYNFLSSLFTCQLLTQFVLLLLSYYYTLFFYISTV